VGNSNSAGAPRIDANNSEQKFLELLIKFLEKYSKFKNIPRPKISTQKEDSEGIDVVLPLSRRKKCYIQLKPNNNRAVKDFIKKHGKRFKKIFILENRDGVKEIIYNSGICRDWGKINKRNYIIIIVIYRRESDKSILEKIKILMGWVFKKHKNLF